jgi:hypothetical protein
MNDTRRRLLADAKQKIEEGMALLEIARDEEQDYFDNMPESFQSGQKGDDAQEAVDAIQSAYDEVENGIGNIEDLINGTEPTLQVDHTSLLRASLVEVTLIAAPNLPRPILDRANAAIKAAAGYPTL